MKTPAVSMMTFVLFAALGSAAAPAVQPPKVATELAPKSEPIASANIAGQSLPEAEALLHDDNRIIRLRAMWTLTAFGQAAAEPIRGALSHSDPAIRYLAAVAIGDLGSESASKATERLEKMVRGDESDSVSMAAAYALCRAGKTESHLRVLLERLRYPERGMACSAAELIGRLGQRADAAVETLREVYESNRPGGSGDYHIGGAAKNALRKLGAIQ